MSNIYDINTRQSKNKKVMSFYNKAMKELINFYGINWVNHTPEIYLVNTRKDFNLISGYETEDWVVGKALGYNKLLLFSPESYEKESRHKYSDEEYYSLLKHELSHLFYMIFSKGKGPVWLDEGFAIYTSNQLSTKERPKEFKNFLKYYSHEDEKVYSEAGFVVEGLIKEYGKEKVIGFLRVLPNINSEGVFKNEFKKYFGMELDYFNINNIRICSSKDMLDVLGEDDGYIDRFGILLEDVLISREKALKRNKISFTNEYTCFRCGNTNLEKFYASNSEECWRDLCGVGGECIFCNKCMNIVEFIQAEMS